MADFLAPAASRIATDLLETAIAHHRAGRLAEAEFCYRQVLAATPVNSDATHLLGTLAYQLGRHGSAVELIGRAIAGNPDLGESCSVDCWALT
jgi:protein O-GlcNAc transferase